jgi:COP9 signalosome complex subunit 6
MASTLVSQHASTSGLQIALHPLALLTISDYITRHVLRRQSGPMVGALLGHQNGRELSIEYAYEIVMKSDTIVDTKWFEDKLRLCMLAPLPPHCWRRSLTITQSQGNASG